MLSPLISVPVALPIISASCNVKLPEKYLTKPMDDPTFKIADEEIKNLKFEDFEIPQEKDKYFIRDYHQKFLNQKLIDSTWIKPTSFFWTKVDKVDFKKKYTIVIFSYVLDDLKMRFEIFITPKDKAKHNFEGKDYYFIYSSHKIDVNGFKDEAKIKAKLEKRAKIYKIVQWTVPSIIIFSIILYVIIKAIMRKKKGMGNVSHY
ncbi:hypothetical protein JN00_0158 [Metamycoplasma subdolum]|uniref:Uncharacterized protein n=2 Tax=Metamycoplasma subdolum TaxID=92407 RepID=A0A3M0A392_9BACT|nr:hypothetical protein JN00_0158 [Metamycoplasma subdolum]